MSRRGVNLQCLSAALAVALWIGFSAFAAAAETTPPIEVRLGLLAYEDFQRAIGRYERMLAELGQSRTPPVRFRLAAGTYGDILQWLRQGKIDVAVVSPGLLAAARAENGESVPLEYLASLTLPPPQAAWLPAENRSARREHYRAVCVVPGESPLFTVDDLRRAAASDRVRFLFVDPLSVSGRIAPQHALREAGITVRTERIEYTYSHSQSLRRLLDAKSPLQQVAFVWDDASLDPPESAPRLRRLPLAELERLAIPGDAVIARADLPYAKVLRAAIAGLRRPEFVVWDDWSERYAAVRSWMQSSWVADASGEGPKLSLDDLGAMLVHYARSHPQPPRLAVVFSGGGAKCAYQVGAMFAIEEALARCRESYGQPGLDIGLVVGTSGGAINALPVALGITRSEAGRADFQQVWHSLDQRDLVRPTRLVRTNIGLWFALFQIGLVLWWVRYRYPANATRRRDARWRLLVGLALIEILVGYLPWSPWRRLGTNHWVHHAWLWCTFGVHWSAWCLLGAGLAAMALRWSPEPWQSRLSPGRPWATRLIVGALLLLPVLQVVTVLFHEQTLSEGYGIEHALATEFPALVDRHLQREGSPGLDMPARTDAQRMQSASRQIVERRLFERDMVLTGSCLAQSSGDLPDDLYFFVSGRHSPKSASRGARGIDLAEHPRVLLDVIMGSGSIYPMFPPRTLQDFPRPGESVDLVDGGFAHNSPVEAAVAWGATHVVLIEASPSERDERRNFLDNMATAFNHLYAQAQLIDARSRRQVMVFTLAPQPPHLCVLDFSDNLIEQAIRKGYREARGDAASGDAPGPALRKEVGEPVFWEPGATTKP